MTKERIENAVVIATAALFFAFISDLIAGYAVDRIDAYVDVCTTKDFEKITCPKLWYTLKRTRVVIKGNLKHAKQSGFTCEWMRYRSYTGLFDGGPYYPYTCWI